MSYKYETQHNSPNYTENSQVPATWGRGRIIQAIAIHWWGDPANNPSYEGIINYLCRSGGNSSAHLVVTGTGRRAAQLVDFDDASWATNSANPYTISIECDPRCRPEDYDTVAEVIAQIWDAYGYLPLVPHRQFVATACPGNYNLAELERIAKTKDGSGDWGIVTNKGAAPAPQPAGDNLYRVMHGSTQKAAYSSEKNAWNGYVEHGEKGTITFQGKDVTSQLRDKYKVKPAPQPEPKPETPPVVVVPEQPEKPSETKLDESSTTLLQDLLKAVRELTALIKSIFKQGS